MNIVFLLPDQLRRDFVGSYGGTHVRTPEIDALAAQSTVYDWAVSPSPVCIPARASLMVGQNAVATGVLSNTHWLRPDHDECGVQTWASLLSQAGYHTEAVGKMHFIPWDVSEGFDHRVICEDKKHIYIQDDYADYLQRRGLRKLHSMEERDYREFFMASVSPIPLEHQCDKWVGDQACEFIENYEGDAPFALMVGFPGPHDPYNPPEERADAFAPDDMPPPVPATPSSRELSEYPQRQYAGPAFQLDLSTYSHEQKMMGRARYAALIEIVDEQIGRIVKALEAKGVMDDTVIVFASDHGDFLGDFDLVGKTFFYDQSLRIPLMVRIPGGAGGERRPELVSLTDLFATILELGGVAGTPCQDSLVLPGLGFGDVGREFVLGATDLGVMMLRSDGHKFNRYANGVTELYDTRSDPQEQQNVATDPAYASVRNEIEDMLVSECMRSFMDGASDRSFPYLTQSAEHAFQQREWSRPYPFNPNRGNKG